MILRKSRAFASAVLRALTILLLIMLVGLALYVSVGRQLTPRVADYKDWLEQRLTLELGMPVSIGRLTGEWLRFTPRFILEDLRLGEDSSLQLQRVSVSPSLLESAQQRRLVVASTVIEALDIRFEQQSDGRWQLAGVTGTGPAPGPEVVFQLLTRLARLSLTDTHLGFIDRDGNSTSLEQAQLDLQNSPGLHLLSVQAQLPGSSDLIRIDAELTGSVLAELGGQAYLRLPRADYSVFMPAFPANGDASVDVAETDVAGELWVDFENGQVRNLVFTGQGDLTINSQSEGHSGEILALENMRVRSLHISHEVERNLWVLYADDMSFELAGQSWPQGDLSLSYQPGAAAELQLEALELGMLSRILTTLPLDARLTEEVLGFNPRGQLQRLKLNASFADNALSAISLVSNIEQGAISAFRGAPSFWGVDGYAELNIDAGSALARGFVEVDSTSLSMHLPNLFNDIWNYDRVNGRVGFLVDAGGDANIRIASGVVVAESDIVNARGKFATEIQLGEERYIDIELQLGALAVDISRKAPYLPTAPNAPRSAQGVLGWVNDAVLAGEGAGSGLIFRGRVQQNSEPVERTLQMFFSVADGTVRFDPAWPELEELDGFVVVDNGQVDISASAGSSLGINFNSSVASVTPNPGGGRWLTVSGLGRGSAAQGLQYLQRTPVTEGIAQYFSSWTAEGDTDIELELSIPLYIEGARPAVSLSLAFEDNRLFIPEYDLQIEALAGRLLYSDELGLRSEGLTGAALGQPLTASIVAGALAAAADSPSDVRSTVVSWEGVTSPDALQEWNGFPAAVKPLLSQFEGELSYQAELQFPAGETATGGGAVGSTARYPGLRVRSNLETVAVSLPEPFNKPADQARAMDLRLEFRPAGPVIDLQWQDLVQMNMMLVDGLPQSGLIFLGATSEGLRVRRLNPAAPGVEVLGSLPKVDYAEWQRSFSEMFTTEPATGAVASRSMNWLSQLQGSAELSVGELAVAGENFDQLNLSLRRIPDAWELGLLGDDISGRVVYALADGEPWRIDLDYLHLGEAPEPETITETVVASLVETLGDPLAGSRDEATVEEPDAAAAGLEVDVSEFDLEDLPAVEYELPREDPLVALDPRNFPSMQFSVEKLTLSGADFGSWNFTLEAGESGASFRNLQTTARGLSIGNAARPAEFRWIYDGQTHRSELDAQITATDIGPVLSAYGYAPSLQSSSASFDARLNWDGTPAYFSALGLNGDVDIKINNGRFQQRAGVANSALRLISIINFDAVVRRLRFSDDFVRSGLSYDEISGQVNLTDGIVKIVDRLQIIGPASLFQVAGELSLAEQTIDADLYITLPVSENIPWLSGLAVLNNLINWQLAIGVFLFDRIFGEQVDNLTSAQYTLKGPWDSVEPRLYQVFASGS
ncbi:MAG: YhdP family protein [Pseudohongiella sp.]|nr:YhdP family protein [Pseudohongiella sp.]